MIILRHKQREYSGRGTKFLRAIKSTSNKASTALDNLGLAVGNKLKVGGRSLQPESVKKFKFNPKTNRQINRETIKSKENLKEKAINGITNTAAEITNAAVNGPGALVQKGARFAGEHPITAASQVGGKVLMVTNPETAAIPVGGIGTGLEAALKKKSTRYDKATKKLGEFLDENHTGGKIIKNGTNAIVQGFRNMAGV